MVSPNRTARTALLREVLEVAIAVGRRADADGVPVPGRLRPVLSMARVGSRALAAADRAGDDDAFRALVAEAVAPEELDDAGRLWLTRPPGWEDQLEELVQRQADAAAEADARRALDRERRARRRAEEDRDRARADLDRLRAEVAALREDVEAATRRAEEDGARAVAAADERAAAVRALKREEALHARAHAELREARTALAAAEAARAAAVQAIAPAPAPDPAAAPTAAARPPAGGSDPDRPAPVVAAAPAEPPIDRGAAAAAVGSAARSAAELARALDALAATFRPVAPEPARRPRRPEGPGPARRQRPSLPGGLHDDSPEAAAHLVRLDGCALLVDGYNATMATWPGRDLPEQRRRLVDALDQLEARVGVDATVVFDGVEEAWRRSASRRVDVRFTPAGVEADDVILDLVDRLPPDRPVVVASDDRRVRTGARQRGAHPIGTEQLRSLLG
ncbi:NYN domain-containing protein [Iamia sp. SCSIO 61187]|uniref:NYN domain-containing protein n=1 Tax=Iamia sp. SCSIO 61187 TaxID=2722752 RepID=UPI001C62BC08|nr:NYN domain-containing protein [Iamia sp. SCSIO 61187]QYG93733.1 NYN domain-containing protein [Iamia sp. SCSIO 61187]